MKSVSLVLRHGKTVRLDAVLSSNCSISSIQVSGDFFVYPEEALEELEKRLLGCASGECVEEAFSALSSAVVLGLDSTDLKKRLLELLEECRAGMPSRGE